MENNDTMLQQEIAPCTDDEKNADSTPAPAETKSKKPAGVFNKKTTRYLTYTATFTALATVANIFSVQIIPRVAYLSFTYIPVFFAGIFLGPITGFLTGILADLIGALIAPQGPYLPLIGIASGLIGLIPGLVFKPDFKNKIINSFWTKTAVSMVLVLLICTAGLNTFSLWFAYSSNSKTFWAYLWIRFPWQLMVASINAAAICLLYLPLKRYVFRFN